MARLLTLAALLLGSTTSAALAQTLAPAGGPIAPPTSPTLTFPTAPKGLCGPGTQGLVAGGNDSCGSATVITGFGPFLGDNIGAGTDGPASCGGFGADVWYRWTSPVNGPVTVSLCNGGTNYDTTLAVYAGGGCVGSELACNDDTCGLSSQVVFPAVASGIYKIRIGGFVGSIGSYEMTIALPPSSPPNGADLCSTPAFIAGRGPHPFDTTGATTGVEGQTEGICFAFGTSGIENDVWFTWASPVTAGVTIDLCGQTGMDSKIAVYDGFGCPTAPALACNDDSCGLQSMIVFPAVKGRNYTIQVGNYPTAGAGVGTFTITFPPPPTACSLDDGVSELAYTMGAVPGEELIWLERFGAPGSSTRVHSIAAAFGSPVDGNAPSPNGTPAQLAIWDDPNDDGNPADAVLLQIVSIVTSGNDNDIFNVAALSPPVVVNGVYFVGAGIVTPGANEYNAAFDRSVPSLGRSWATGTPGGLANYGNLAANGLLIEMDGFGDPGVWLLRADCEPAIVPFCFPGAGGVLPCPCGNPPGGGGRGCNNFSSFSGGASLSGSGNPSLSADSLSLSALGENNTALTVFWTGNATNSPPGVVHGAGIRCVTGLKRIYTGNASGGSITRPGSGDPSVSAATGGIVAGQTRYYFTVYRDPNAAVPCGSSAATVNLSSAVGANWGF